MDVSAPPGWFQPVAEFVGYGEWSDLIKEANRLEIEKVGAHLGLSRFESFGIYFYTCEFRQNNTLFSTINGMLRGTDLNPEAATFVPSLSAMISKALGKLPTYVGDAFRQTNLPAGLKARLEIGKPFSDAGFMSASTDASLAGGIFGGHDMLVIRSKTGRIIKDLSAFPLENEVLFLPGTRFEIRHIETLGKGILVQLVE